MKQTSLSLVVLLTLTATLSAQPPQPDRGREPGDDPVSRLMALDKNKDGKLSPEEYADSRLKPLLEKADANKDQIVSREEITELAQREGLGQEGPGGREGGPGFGPGREGGPGGPGREGGPGFGRGRGMRGGMMRPGMILPEFMVQELKLSDEQRSSLAKLQATVDAELAKILNQEQQAMLKQFGGEPRREGEGRPGEGRRPEGDRPAGDGPRDRPRN